VSTDNSRIWRTTFGEKFADIQLRISWGLLACCELKLSSMEQSKLVLTSLELRTMAHLIQKEKVRMEALLSENPLDFAGNKSRESYIRNLDSLLEKIVQK
jgi:hypothetical protein